MNNHEKEAVAKTVSRLIKFEPKLEIDSDGNPFCKGPILLGIFLYYVKCVGPIRVE